MFVPLILGSDKTTVSVATSHNEFYPLYISIGNIHNNVRRAHRDGVVLIGFLSIPKSKILRFVYYIHCYSLSMLYIADKKYSNDPKFRKFR